MSNIFLPGAGTQIGRSFLHRGTNDHPCIQDTWVNVHTTTVPEGAGSAAGLQFSQDRLQRLLQQPRFHPVSDVVLNTLGV